MERGNAAERRAKREVKRKRKTPTPNAEKRRNVVLGLMASVNINAQRIYTTPRHSCLFTLVHSRTAQSKHIRSELIRGKMI